MKKIILGILAAIVVAAGLLFATADTKEEKAAKNVVAAREFIERGDDSRAVVELRNALRNDETLRDARILLAQIFERNGRKSDAFAQYRQIYERNPQDIDAARALATIAFDGMAWDDARKYADVVLAAHPDDPAILAISQGVAYRRGAEARNTDDMDRAAAAQARLLAADPGLVRARRVLIADRIRNNQLEEALRLTDEGIALTPQDRDLDNTRLVLLGRLERMDEMEQQLLSMIKAYPQDEELRQSLVRFYVATGRIDDAESELRNQIDPNGTTAEPRLVLMRFLSEVRNPTVMRDELDKVLAEDPLPADIAANQLVFRTLKAQADFALGARDAAMAAMEGLIKEAEPSAEIDRAKIELARMRVSSNNTVGARALVEEVLARDPGQTEAIKMKSAWLVEEDKTEEAISMLRDALADAPNDAQILTLLAGAYQREGRPELMSDMLARAVEVSNQAPTESLRYAAWLFQQSQFTSAETVLIDALRRQPNNAEILVLLARTHLAMEDWGRAGQDIDTLAERMDTDTGRATVNELRAQLLARQGRNDDLTQFLDQIARDDTGGLTAQIALIRNTVASGKLDQAMTEARALAAEQPDEPQPRLLIAQLQLALGQTEEALSGLQALTRDRADYLPAWQLIQAVQLRTNQTAAALETIDAALKQFPDRRELNMSKAFVLEKNGDIEGAIALYETLYAADTNDAIVANNLASLLATTRDDQASLDRAWTVARRLNGLPVPAFQDTYGWIAFRRGETAQALPILEQAAKGLPGDPAVAYHLGRAYVAQGRTAEGQAEFDRAEALLMQGTVSYPALAQDLVRARAELK